MEKSTIILTILSSVLASTGLWGLLTRIFEKKSTQKDAQTEMLIGLAHDRICYLGEKIIARGWITRAEYENLHDYLYVPYHALGGNGTAEKIMTEIKGMRFCDRQEQSERRTPNE